MKVITSAQTLLFLSLFENKDVNEIAKNRRLCAELLKKIGPSAYSSA